MKEDNYDELEFDSGEYSEHIDSIYLNLKHPYVKIPNFSLNRRGDGDWVCTYMGFEFSDSELVFNFFYRLG